uniref:Uncharacterized protein n=1 Tax=Rhizophagus irregularis (strain DAOM 181602 / DAOM 197198 / MUCL 43194) TaxID=747089 RepID=U9T4U7_RHIID
MVMQNEEDTVIVKNIDAGMYVIENKHTIIEIRSIVREQSKYNYIMVMQYTFLVIEILYIRILVLW